MIHLFIDTNIFLNFYKFSKDQLNKLEELVSLIKAKKVKLYLTEQILDEFNRNREKSFKFTIDHIDNFSTKFTQPIMCVGMKEMKSIHKLLVNVEKNKKKILIRLGKQFRNNKLHIDKIMSELLSISNSIEVTTDIYERAVRRYNRGNPPGKDKSYGDAINWEIILEHIPRRQPLYFIGNDGDFISPLNNNEFSDFLNIEWKRKKGSSVKFYSSILEFLKDKNPKSKVTSEEVKKEKAITNETTNLLANSNLTNLINQANLIDHSKFTNQIYTHKDLFDSMGIFRTQLDPSIVEAATQIRSVIDSLNLPNYYKGIRDKKSGNK